MARGLTSLLQLIATSAEATTATSATLPALDILDGPRFAWRGLTVDVVRRFFPPAQIRTLIDLAALYKLDVLHLHLTDDQGWRNRGPAGPRRCASRTAASTPTTNYTRWKATPPTGSSPCYPRSTRLATRSPCCGSARN